MIAINNVQPFPFVSRPIAVCLGVIVSYGVVRAIFVTGDLPLFLPLVASVLSIAALGKRRYSVEGLTRIGFHLGLFAYFLSYPILSPESIDPSIREVIHQTVGGMLLLMVIGFEAGYYLKKRQHVRLDADEPLSLGQRQQKWLRLFVCFGMAAWLVTLLDYSYAAGVSPTDALLTMRGAVEGARENAVTTLGHLSYILHGGLYLAAASAVLLLTSVRRISKFSTFSYWLVLLICALIGFLAGSRAIFLYSFIPLILTIWLRLSKLNTGRPLRLVLIALTALVVATTWGAMSALRGADIRNYEGGFEEMNPVAHAHGAFDIYSQTAVIVETFPEKIDYEYGRSLVPLVLGWVPRTLWSGKPYPFSIFANIIKGETLEERAASLAVGLPGEGYGNFGLIGVLLWSFLMGLACQIGDAYIGRMHSSNPLRLFLAAMMAIWAAMIVRGGVPEMFYMGLNVVMFPLALSWFLSRRKRIAHPRTLTASPIGVYQRVN
ncbi:MAG: O-antigen polymerase [Acidobacteriota bacterium]